MNPSKLRRKTTLVKRVRYHVVLLTLACFTLFSLMTLFIVFSLEDAFFKEQLRQHSARIAPGRALPEGYQLVDDLSSFDISITEKLRYVEFDHDFGEFKHEGKHYHFMNTGQGVLVLNSSELGIISRAIDDILLLMLIVLLPAIALTYWVSSKIADKSLKPFTQIHRAIANSKDQTQAIKHTLDDIDEEDIRLLASQLVDAIDQRTNMLEEQIVFNQGMAHEIRTPLQVMSNSVELMTSTVDGVDAIPAFHRLNNAILRMNRISSALLWLTSTSKETHNSDAKEIIKNVLRESTQLLETHKITLTVNEHHSLELPVPAVVLELITLNLLTNVIHHSQAEGTVRVWAIDIHEHYVVFSNPVTTEPAATRRQGFGLGLMLVSKLAEKFSIDFKATRDGDQYQVILSLPADIE
ncbi:MAG: sensor histidine kinase [Cellvibrionaceae bacterium]